MHRPCGEGPERGQRLGVLGKGGRQTRFDRHGTFGDHTIEPGKKLFEAEARHRPDRARKETGLDAHWLYGIGDRFHGQDNPG